MTSGSPMQLYIYIVTCLVWHGFYSGK